MMERLDNARELARQIRRDALRMVHGAQSGHPGGALSCADYIAYLYAVGMRYSAQNFCLTGEGEDVFLLSNGHVSAAWYSALAHSGFFPKDELATFRKLESRLQGHPTPSHHLPGIRIASGSLGQGLSVANGIAYSKQLAQQLDHVFVLMGDGELQEGQVWEAALFSQAKRLGHLIAAVDWNNAQIDGPVEEVIPLGNLEEKFSAFGWHPFVVDGHDLQAIHSAVSEAKATASNGRPKVILLRTHMGQGVDFMQGDYGWHGKPLNDEQLEKALQQIPTTTFGDYACA